MTDRTFYGVIVVAVLVLVALVATAGTARGDHRTPPENSLFVDTAVYLPTKVTPGGTYHYETPETNPNVVFLLNHEYDHVWTGNGSEHLPCEGGIHWIANKNVLTVSNCLDSPSTTTTTVPPSTTTSVMETTTTTESPTTTTTQGPSTTTTTGASTTTETSSPSTSTSVPTGQPTVPDGPNELPYTGLEDADALGLAGLAALLLGSLLLGLSWKRGKEED